MLNRNLPYDHRPLLYVLTSLSAALVLAAVLTEFDGLTVLNSRTVSVYGTETGHTNLVGVATLVLLAVALIAPVAIGIIFFGERIPGIQTLVGQFSLKWRMASLKRDVDQSLLVVLKSSAAHQIYFKALQDARVKLDELPTPEQFEIIVSMLMTENDRARSEVVNANAALEANLTSIGQLTADIAVVEAIASLDSLTGLGNRRFFDQHFATSVANAHAFGKPCSLILCDLDNFKVVNDTFGHLLGDDVLRAFGDVLKSCLRPADPVARYGGEEFGVVLFDARLEDAQLVAERMRKAVEERRFKVRQTGQGIGKITASFGVGQLAAKEDTTQFFARVDKLLYQAKSTGRNRVTW